MPRPKLIQARTTSQQKGSYEDAARAAKKTLTDWIRDTLDAQAKRDLSQQGE